MGWEAADTGIAAAPEDPVVSALLCDTLAGLRGRPLVQVLSSADDLTEARALAKAWRRKSDATVVIGTGGASLGAQTLVAIAPERERVWFLDNIDPDSVSRMLAAHDLTRLTWLIVSKSGATVETLSTLMAVYGTYAAAGLAAEFAVRAAVITEVPDSPLGQFAAAKAVTVFAHPAIGGRYSVFTLVGLLPGLLAGLDAERVRAGALAWFEDALGAGAQEFVRHVRWLHGSMHAQPVHVVMPYADRLKPYTRWFQQIWAESLGKEGQGSTPFAALGTIDQHSQLQLFLAGPKDKSFTLVLPRQAGQGPLLDAAGVEALSFLDGHRIGDVMEASARAIATTFERHGVPMRVLRTDMLDEEAIGALLMRHMAETIGTAALMEVDPYGQPAVEEGKRLTRQYLAEGDL